MSVFIFQSVTVVFIYIDHTNDEVLKCSVIEGPLNLFLGKFSVSEESTLKPENKNIWYYVMERSTLFRNANVKFFLMFRDSQ
jgi:hypothetical protein